METFCFFYFPDPEVVTQMSISNVAITVVYVAAFTHNQMRW